MAVKHIAPRWNRRTFLTGAGLSMLATAGLTALQPLRTQSWAAGERTRFVCTWNSPDILDPHVKYDVGAAAFNLNLYDNLLRYQGNPPEIVPWLAETHEVADGGRKWTFHLRRDARFHDGSALTAEAVSFSFARLLAQDERARLYEEACRLVVEDAPDLWVYNTIEYVPLAKTVQGFKFSLVGSGQEFWHVSFDSRA